MLQPLALIKIKGNAKRLEVNFYVEPDPLFIHKCIHCKKLVPGPVGIFYITQQGMSVPDVIFRCCKRHLKELTNSAMDFINDIPLEIEDLNPTQFIFNLLQKYFPITRIDIVH